MTKLILILLVVVAVGGAAYYYMAYQQPSGSVVPTYQQSSQPATENAGSANSQSPATGGPKTIKDLLSLGTAQKCVFHQAISGVDTTGTLYAASGKMRGDFSSAVMGRTIASHYIVKDSIGYAWTDLSNNGYKKAIDTSSGSSASSGGTQQSIDVNQKIDYSCTGWAVDESMFALPSTIKFQ